jgi:hypothetical protein
LLKLKPILPPIPSTKATSPPIPNTIM